MTNNQLLIEQMIADGFAAQSEYETEGSYFEFLAASKLMAPYGLDDDEIVGGIIGNSHDGGCDAVYMFCNELLLSEDSSYESVGKRGSRIEIVVIQSKKSKSFTEDVFLKWKDICGNLLSFGNTIKQFEKKYSPEVLETFARVRDVIATAARKGATVTMRFIDVANADQISTGVELQAKELEKFTQATVGAGAFSASVEFVDANRLMEIWYPPDENELLIRFSGAYTSVPQRSDSFGLVTLSDYYDFLVSQDGQLRGYLFEANIRDYEGKVEVNKAIRNTLENGENEDFWWLNNGVTILASSAIQATGGEVRMEKPRIVNGLQTTYEIFDYMSNRESEECDDRKVMVRIIVPNDDTTRNKVIMATNSQTMVKKTSLRATDPIHLQIEYYLKPKGLFYERRKNHYKNQGKKPEEIVSISFLAQCLMSILLMQPNQARARPSTLLSDDKKYKQLFKKNGTLDAYYRAALLGKRVMLRFPKVRPQFTRSEVSDLRFYVLMGVAYLLARKTNLEFDDLARLDVESATDEIIGIAADEAKEVYECFGGSSTVAKSSYMPNEVAKRVMLHFR